MANSLHAQPFTLGTRACVKLSRQILHFTTLSALVLFLYGCSAVSQKEEPSDTTPEVSTATHNSYLGTALQAEFSAQRGDLVQAYQAFYELAVQQKHLPSIKRATQMARTLKNPQLIEQSTGYWLMLAPADEAPYRIRYQLFIESDRVKEATATLVSALENQTSPTFLTRYIDDSTRSTDSINKISLSLEGLPDQWQSNLHIMMATARLSFLKGEFEEAIQLAQSLLTNQADQDINVDIYLILAFSQDQSGDLQQATQTLTQGLKVHPDNIRLLTPLCEFLIRQDDPNAAEELFNQASLTPAKYNQLTLNLAEQLVEHNYPERALSILTKVNYDATGLPDQFRYLEATARAELNQKEQAVALLMEIQGPLIHVATIQIAQWLYDLERSTEINTLILDRANGATVTDLVMQTTQLHEENGRLDLADELLTGALVRYPQADSIRYKKAILADQQGRWQETEKELRHLLDRDPDNAQYMNALGYTLLVRSPRRDEAISLIEKAYELSSDDPAIIDSLGWAYFLKNQLEQAIFYLEKAWRLLPDPEIAAHYGESLWARDQFELAIEIWREALQADPSHPTLNETIKRLNPSLNSTNSEQENDS